MAEATPASSTAAAPSGPAAPRLPSRTEVPPARPGARAAANHRRWKQIEWVWTLIPIGLLIAVAVPSLGLLYALDTGPSAYGSNANYHVNITGQQWVWNFQYTDAYAQPGVALPTNATSTSVLYVPANAVVELNVTSVDVVHDFNVPQLGVRIDAIPGRVNHAWFTIPAGTAPWTRFLVQCTEFCGQGHYAMLSYVVVVPNASLPPP